MESDEDKDELDFVESEKLLAELQKRFDTMVFLACSNRTQSTDDLTLCFGGAFHSIIGLLEVGRIGVEAGGGRSEGGFNE